ncbi:MAG: hypothetical protein OXU96_10700 [Gammaproteobacteria bacterium]|nr:hypothetical protein [Gammaproteobacteria bacterium]
MPKDTELVVRAIRDAAREKIDIGVPDYAPFVCVDETENTVIIRRQNGNTVSIPDKTIIKAIEAVRCDHWVYCAGPGALREAAGITHVTSPTWALIRCVPLNALIE